jgi:prevent-host-death family protein
MQVETVDVAEAQANLKGVLDKVTAGVQVILSENEKPVARLIPISQRIAGLHAGSIWTSPDFDEPLPDEFWAGGKE